MRAGPNGGGEDRHDGCVLTQPIRAGVMQSGISCFTAFAEVYTTHLRGVKRKSFPHPLDGRTMAKAAPHNIDIFQDFLSLMRSWMRIACPPFGQFSGTHAADAPLASAAAATSAAP